MLGVLLSAASIPAQAAFIETSWTDEHTFGGGLSIGDRASHTYKHDLTEVGFVIGRGLVTDFLLSIDLRDDGDTYAEKAHIDVPGSWFGDSFVTSFGLSGSEYAGWSIAGLFELNFLGTVTVTVSSVFGDFVLDRSRLYAHGYAAPVPEPGTLALLALGLLAMAFASRRRRAVLALARRSPTPPA